MRIVAAVLAVFLGGMTTAAAQDALLGIYGAWVLEGEECGRIFANDNGRVVFGAESRGPLPAFIINPSSISNNEYICAVRDYSVRQADVSFTGRCDFGRRKGRQRFTMREINGRFQMEIDRAFVPVKRCDVAALKDLATVRAEREQFERENASAQDKARGLWASSAETCERAFTRDQSGRYQVSSALPAGEIALLIAPGRFETKGSICTAQQVTSDPRGGRDLRADLLCTADGREFLTNETITVLDPNTIERTPAARKPQPQRLVRCTPTGWEEAVRE